MKSALKTFVPGALALLLLFPVAAQAKEAGATGWIIKPFVPAKLIEAINKVLR